MKEIDISSMPPEVAELYKIAATHSEILEVIKSNLLEQMESATALTAALSAVLDAMDPMDVAVVEEKLSEVIHSALEPKFAEKMKRIFQEKLRLKISPA
ncbi:hypothetical protein [Cupriavidus sp. RAF12]|uniref:hypothetical protein n=1 Tax=Cupriavidus sp. RAF12 TaxID=3233050 RepID=UPI003F91ECBB